MVKFFSKDFLMQYLLSKKPEFTNIQAPSNIFYANSPHFFNFEEDFSKGNTFFMHKLHNYTLYGADIMVMHYGFII